VSRPGPPDEARRDDLPPRGVIGADALAALAVPARFAILNHLLTTGPATASACAPVVGETASNCSWHLRALAKAGLVERVPGGEGADGRTRPWRATAVGFRVAPPTTPAEKVASRALAAVSADHADALFRRHLDREVTPGELTGLLERIDAMVRPYVRPIRTDAPEGSDVVRVSLRAFLDPDSAGERSA
jgi:DNA-binding MarR family transcriptional regulator